MWNLRLYLFFIFSFFSLNGEAQNQCFHKVYTLNDTVVIFNNVALLDSNYLLSGTMGKGSFRFNPLSCKLDKSGNVIGLDIYVDNDYLHKTCYSKTELEKNVFGDYQLHYSTIKKAASGLWLHSRLKWNPTLGFGTEMFLDTLSEGFYTYFDSGRSILDHNDSSYFTVGNYTYFSALDTLNTLPDNNGLVVIKFNQSNDSIIWLKKLSYTSPNGPTLAQVNLLQKENGELLLIGLEIRIVQGVSGTYSKLKFYKINPINGSVNPTITTLHDTPVSIPGYGAAFINNEKDLLISYTDSDTLYSTTTIPQPYYAVRPAVARLDSNFNVVWKDTLYSYLSSTLSPYGCLEKIVVEGDSTFVSAFAYLQVTDEGLPNQKNYDAVRITKRSQNTGEVIWNRDFTYFDLDYYNDPLYTIHDLERTLDGGYIFVGQVENFDSLQANAPGQLGYVLKTNCLGFLADPQAGFTTLNNDSLGVNFQNTSLMGGSYLWDFGDSTTLTTGGFDSAQPPVADSLQNAVFHQYSDTGMYEVTLIAYGCNGANDTVKTSVHITKFNEPEPPINPNVVNYMALGPNPVKSGESVAVYVGNLPSENCWLSFYDYQGKLILERAIPQDKSTYIIVLPFSAGVYQAVLRDGEKKLEVEKVMIQ